MWVESQGRAPAFGWQLSGAAASATAWGWALAGLALLILAGLGFRLLLSFVRRQDR